MNVIETTKGELYKAVPHIPARCYEKDVHYQRTVQEVAEHIDKQYQECEDAGNKVHSYKQSKDWADADRKYYLYYFRTNTNKVIGQETIDVIYPQSGWFVSTPKWCRIFLEVEVVKVWDERTDV